MNCSDVERELDDYIDGLLREEEKERIDGHLAQCADCRRELRALSRLITDAAGLPRDIAPSRDLWPGVAARLGPREDADASPSGRRVQPFWSRHGRVAAAAVVVAVVASAVTMTIINRSSRERMTTSGPESVMPVFTLSTQMEYRSAEIEYLKATEKLLRTLDERKATVSPGTMATIDENVRIIEKAISQIQKALESDPANLQLNTLLLAAYKEEIELLSRAAKLPVQG